MKSIEEIQIGDELPSLVKNPTTPQLFRYSAITWNPHRIHYDAEYAEREGHPNILVQAHLHGAAIQELVMNWLEDDGRLVGLSWSNVGRATPDEDLTVGAEVTAINEENGMVEFDAWTRTTSRICAEGRATVKLDE